MAARKKATPPGNAEPPENVPAATNGAPDEDELKRRREARSNAGQSLADRVENGDEDEPELFPDGSLEGDGTVTLKNLIKSRTPVEVAAKMGSMAVPIRGGGFFDPESEITLLVRVLPGGPVPVATRKKGEERSQIEKWAITQPLTPIYVQEAGQMYSRVQILEMLDQAKVPSAVIAELLGEEPSRAQA